jgi:hypothetical protein
MSKGKNQHMEVSIVTRHSKDGKTLSAEVFLKNNG